MVRAVGQPISDIATCKFTKRTYSLRELYADISFLLKNVRDVRRIMRENLISSAFRERLMLSVTSVYGCRYCCWAHTREALRSGIDQKEITGLLTGSVDNCPQEEAVALLYAQHWADYNASPDPEATRRLEQAYGAEKAKMIHIVLRMIRVGNLWGNSWDCFLYRISFGRWGK
ncbi:MAG: carboxymuconolactone decarboxylase family protein [Dehalococcoidia bacterium]|nr:carboxymuconolactone decarboxylase family protein [Dehalococcoidia bacterium]